MNLLTQLSDARAWMLARYPIALALVFAVQVLLLGQMVYGEIALRKSGREVVLPVIPVDPRSLFRGDYVILSYPFTQISAPDDGVTLPDEKELTPGRTIWLTLARGADGAWQARKLALVQPATGIEGEVTLRGKVSYFSRGEVGGVVHLQFGIESYFVPEGEGLRLEQLVRDRMLSVVARVGASGRAAITGLEIDGERVYDEPLF